MDAGAEHQRHDLVRSDTDRLVEVRDRLGPVAPHGPHASPLQQRTGRVWVELDGPIECLLGGLQLVVHHQRQAERLLQRGVFRIDFDGRLQVAASLLELVREQVEQAAGPPDVLVARGKLDRLVVVRGPLLAVIRIGGVAEHDVSLGCLQPVVGKQLDRLRGGGAGPFPVATGEAFQLRDHELGVAELGIAINHLVEIAHRKRSQPRPLRIRGIDLVDRLHDPAGAIHERVGVEILGKLLLFGGEPLLDGPLAEVEHVGEVVDALRGQLRIDGGIEVVLARRIRGGGRFRHGTRGLRGGGGLDHGGRKEARREQETVAERILHGIDASCGPAPDAGPSCSSGNSLIRQ